MAGSHLYGWLEIKIIHNYSSGARYTNSYTNSIIQTVVAALYHYHVLHFHGSKRKKNLCRTCGNNVTLLYQLPDQFVYGSLYM